MNTLRLDFRYALRPLLKRPGFTTVAVLTLALGIGTTTAIFSAVDHVVLRPLPYADADRVVTLWETDSETGERHKEVSPGNFVAWEERSGAFESMGLAEPFAVDLTSPDAPPGSVPTWHVTEGFFDALGVRPIVGAGFQPVHYQPGGPAAVMISHGLWQRRFGGDPSLIGRTIEVNGSAAVVAGVLPPWLAYPEPKDIWTPKRLRPGEPGDRVSSYMHTVARLAPGISVAEAQAELDAVAATLARDFPQTNGDAGIRVVPLKEEVVGGVRPAMLVLLGAALLLLLIACANVAHLVLARATEREHELSVRASLGASRGRLARQLLTESLLLALGGGIVGIGFAAVAVEALVALSPPELPRIDSIALDVRVLVFAYLVTLATVSLFGLLPAIRLSRADALAALRGGRRSHSSERTATRLRDGLIVGETAVAMLLLIGAGLLARSFESLVSEDLGFVAKRRATVQAFIWDRNPTAEERIRTVAEIDERFEALPGVERAAVVTALPFHPTRIETRMQFAVADRPVAEGRDREVLVNTASYDYFETMGIPLLAGRTFDRVQDADGLAQAVINESLARRFFRDEDPLGQRITISTRGSDRHRARDTLAEGQTFTLEVAGVAGDTRPTSFASLPEPVVYRPYGLTGTGSITFVVETKGDAGAVMPALRRQLQAADPGQSIHFDATLEQLVSDTLVTRRFQLLLNSAFSGVALLLIGVGVFGVISYVSRQRANEIGIRMALGARAGDVLGMVLRQGAILALVGIAVGLVAALGLTRFLSSLLYGISATDAVTFASVSVLLAGVALLASYLPARRATRVNPVETLRNE